MPVVVFFVASTTLGDTSVSPGNPSQRVAYVLYKDASVLGPTGEEHPTRSGHLGTQHPERRLAAPGRPRADEPRVSAPEVARGRGAHGRLETYQCYHPGGGHRIWQPPSLGRRPGPQAGTGPRSDSGSGQEPQRRLGPGPGRQSEATALSGSVQQPPSSGIS